MANEYRKAYSSLREQFKENRYTVERKTRELQALVPSKVIAKTAQNIRKESLRNLTEYNATGASHRDPILDEAFWLMSILLSGFEYNQDGSFTDKGAVAQMKEDVSIKETKYKLEVIISGKIKELELGITNWKHLRRFFYSEGIKTAIKMIFPIGWQNIYDRLATLFQMSSDERRPYISQAINDSTEYMNEAIQDTIEEVFGSDGDWDRPRLSRKKGRR